MNSIKEKPELKTYVLPLTDDQVNEVISEIRKNIGDESNRYRHQRNGELRELVSSEFARRHGWKPAGKGFSLTALAGGKIHDGGKYYNYMDYIDHQHGDHAYYYRYPGGIAAGIACHLYDVPDDLEEYAARHNLSVSFPAFPSFWYPGWTRLILYKRKGEN